MEKNNFPTGSSGGGGGKDYLMRSFLNPQGDESPPLHVQDNGENNQEFRALNVHFERIHTWIIELDRAAARAAANGQPPAGTGAPEEVDRPRERVEIAIYNYTAIVGVRNINGEQGAGGFVGAPVVGQVGVAIRINENNNGGENEPVVVAGNRGLIPGNQVRNARPIQERAGAGEVRPLVREEVRNVMGNDNGNILHYTTTTTHAHRSRNGNMLRDLFSLRDDHIFTMLKVTDYAGPIEQHSNNQDLAAAMTSHIDCLKALLIRNIRGALAHQISCVNAVMRLINQAYARRERWCIKLIQTVDFDLRIISDRATNRGCRTRAIIRYDWERNTVVHLCHPDDCQCHQPQVYPTRNFHRRV